MSTFVCTACGARFEGDLREAPDAAFRHSAEHAEPAQKPHALAAGNVFMRQARQLRIGLPTDSSLWAGRMAR